jgi:hypothetical protein
MHYTDAQLTRFNVADLINDYRTTHEHFAGGDMGKWHDTDAMVALCEYAYQCKQKAIAIFKNRHSARIGKYGESVI